MKRTFVTIAAVAALLLGWGGRMTAHALTVAEAQALLATLDANSNLSNTDFSAVMTMVAQDPATGTDRTVVQQFRRDSADMFLMLLQEPAVKRGQGYLRIDDSLWFYDPESRQFAHTSMNDRFNGSDANNSDFRRSNMAEDYVVERVEAGRLGAYTVHILDLKATNNEVTYPTRRIWVNAQTPVLLKSEDYSAGGRLLRTSLFPSYSRVGEDTFIATQMIFVDELVSGKRTTITVTDISVRRLPDTIFTKSYVERVNR